MSSGGGTPHSTPKRPRACPSAPPFRMTLLAEATAQIEEELARNGERHSQAEQSGQAQLGQLGQAPSTRPVPENPSPRRQQQSSTAPNATRRPPPRAALTESRQNSQAGPSSRPAASAPQLFALDPRPSSHRSQPAEEVELTKAKHIANGLQAQIVELRERQEVQGRSHARGGFSNRRETRELYLALYDAEQRVAELVRQRKVQQAWELEERQQYGLLAEELD
jgi:hypothetical protein